MLMDAMVQRMIDWVKGKKFPYFGTPYHQRHPEQEIFDEITIKLIPRYKTSYMSGDEWRFNSYVECKYRGKVFRHFTARDMKNAIMRLPGAFLDFDGNGFPDEWLDHEKKMCDNPACSKPYTSIFMMKKQFSDNCFFEKEYEERDSPLYRKFCDEHRERGDCGLDDTDSNYIEIKDDMSHYEFNPGVVEMKNLNVCVAGGSVLSTGVGK